MVRAYPPVINAEKIVEPDTEPVPVQEPIQEPVQEPIPEPTPTSEPPTEWSDPRPHGLKHSLLMEENKNPVNFYNYFASCSCGFQSRGSKQVVEAAVEKHKVTYGF